MIITFGNQKGGTGKSTLTALFANYLYEAKKSVIILDADSQRSLMVMRDEDKELFNQPLPYEIVECDLKEPEVISSYLTELNNEYDYVLIDSPGNLVENSLIQIFSSSDYIVIPYQYERMSLASTGTFVSAMLQLNEHLKKHSRPCPKPIFAPNKVRTSVGTTAERNIWELTDKTLRDYGVILPRISLLATFTRVNTIVLSKEHSDLTATTLSKLFELICPNIS